MKIKIFLISILSFFAFSSCSESLLNSLNGALDNATKNPGTNNPNPGDTNNPGTDNPGVTDPDNPNTGNPDTSDPNNPGTGDTGDSNSGDSGNQNPVIPTPKPEPSCKVYDPNDPDRDKPAIPENATELEKLSLKYPYLNVSIHSFMTLAYDESNGVKPEDLEKYNTITIAEKKRILELLSLVRFVVNTPEFTKNFLYGQFSKNGYGNDERKSGACGTIEANELLDKFRFLQIIHQFNYPIKIIKKEFDTSNTGAEGGVGVPLYVYPDDVADKMSDEEKRDFNPKVNIYFSAKLNWAVDFGNSSYDINKEIEIVGRFFHEMIHNLGFNHQTPSKEWNPIDPAYNAGYAIIETYKDPTFMEKHAEEIKEFRTFYERRQPELLKEDTVSRN